MCVIGPNFFGVRVALEWVFIEVDVLVIEPRFCVDSFMQSYTAMHDC